MPSVQGPCISPACACWRRTSLTPNQREVLAQATGKSKRAIEEIAAALAPKPPVPDSIRNVPVRTAAQAPTLDLLGPDRAPTPALPTVTTAAVPAPPQPRERGREIVSLSADTFHVHFTASRNVRDKIREAQDLLRHRVPMAALSRCSTRRSTH